MKKVMMGKLRTYVVRPLVQTNVFKEIQDVINLGKPRLLNVSKLSFVVQKNLGGLAPLFGYVVESVLEAQSPMGVIYHPSVFQVVPQHYKGKADNKAHYKPAQNMRVLR